MKNDNVKLKIVLIFMLLALNFLFIVNVVSAGHSDEFISYVSNKIYKDCINRNLIINKVYYDLETPVEPAYTIPWPYTLEHLTLNVIKNSLDSQQWKELGGDFKNKKYGIYLGPGYVGRQLLTCGEHWLDISENDWYWDGNLIEMPKLAVDIKTSGDNSPIIMGGINKTETNINNNSEINVYLKYGVVGFSILLFLFIVYFSIFIFPIWLKNINTKHKFKREKVENNKNMHLARREESPSEVYIIENKDGTNFYNHIKDQFTRDRLGFSGKNTSANKLMTFSEKDSDFLSGEFKTIEIINITQIIKNHFELIKLLKNN